MSVIPPPDARLMVVAGAPRIVVFDMPRFKLQTRTVRKCRRESAQPPQARHRPTVLSGVKKAEGPGRPGPFIAETWMLSSRGQRVGHRRCESESRRRPLASGRLQPRGG